MTTRKGGAPLEITGIHVGKTATRFMLNSGSHVVALETGEYVCVHRECIDARKWDKCEHVAFVKANDKGDPGEVEVPTDG